ncbi:MAG: hypothetical protein PHQ04_09085 [Opitutaceae bacterium]|nr:hypothetical protein [Opitutaceae bacterium]
MKTTLILTAFITALGLPCLAFAEIIGLSVPSWITAESAIYVFASVMATLIALSDYARRKEPLVSAMPRVVRPPLPARRPSSLRPSVRLAA